MLKILVLQIPDHKIGDSQRFRGDGGTIHVTEGSEGEGDGGILNRRTRRTSDKCTVALVVRALIQRNPFVAPS